MVTQESVKKWLKDQHRTREWLADQCGTATQTVNNWLSTERGIPSKAIIVIQRLMAEDEERERIESRIPSALVLHFDREEFAVIQQAAREAGQNTDTWAEEQLRLLCDLTPQDVNSRLGYWQEEKPALKVAEDSPKKPPNNKTA